MRASDFEQSPVGSLLPTVNGAVAFVPASLPRALSLPSDLLVRVERATTAVATLGGVGETLDNPQLLIQPFLRREAVLSSRIEGTQASLSDLYEFEASSRPPVGDVGEVANYVRAMERGLTLLDTLPICVRLVNELHAVLLDGVRGQETRPGEFRDRQVWIGAAGTPIEDARFVPPPHTELTRLMSEWEQWVNDPVPLPLLVRCALLHYQFETIHPYLDGNGRVGRVLIPLFLIAEDVLRAPLLYVSAFFEQHRSEYYDHLLAVSRTGDWAPWVAFFAEGVEEQARHAMRLSRELRDLQRRYREQLQAAGESANAFQLVDRLFTRPIVTRRSVAHSLGLTSTGARNLIERLQRLGLLEELPGRRPAVFAAREIIDALNG